MKIGWATVDWSQIVGPDGLPSPGGSGHYRMVLPARALRLRGHYSVVGTLVANQDSGELGVRHWDGNHHWGFDVVVLQRWMIAGTDQTVRRARANGQVVLNDVDDWFEGLDPGNRAFATTSAASSPNENRQHYRAVLAAGSGIVCSTPFLARRYAHLNRTFLIRNGIDLGAWRPSEPRDGPPTLGWVGALPWRARGDVEVLSGVLGPFCRKHGLRVVHGGHVQGAIREDGSLVPTFREAARLPEDVEIELRQMVPIHEVPDLWKGIDVGLVPLAAKPVNEAKSCLKGLEAAAAGLPFVASASSEYQWLRDEHGIGRTARRPFEWTRHLEALLDPEVRAAEGRANRDRMGAFDLAAIGEAWEKVLANVTP